ncbi:transcriptional regulator, LysR family [Luteibacter sp. 22Crub2.1]|nr:transcriptional regulator, LysR family [Luteibacter sp. 22Crub2.1]
MPREPVLLSPDPDLLEALVPSEHAMPRSLSSSMLTWLRAFEAVARHGNFTRAADELHITQGATSQQIQRLEQALGFRLIERGTRPLGLTGEGERLASVVEASFAQIRHALADIAAPGGATPITLSCSPSFAMQWLTPRLSGLRRGRPRVDIRVFGEFHRLDMAGMASEQLQAAIRYDPGDYENLTARGFLDEYLIPVASPAFMDAHPDIGAKGLLAGEWLLHDARPWVGASELQEWQSWLDETGLRCADLIAGKRFNLAMLAVGAAVAGEGIAMGRTAMVMEELQRGTLVAPFPFAVRSPASYHFITTPAHTVQVDLICDWLQREGEAFAAMRTEVLHASGIALIPGAKY